MVASWRIGVIAIFAAFNAACAQLPSDAKVKAFGDTTSKVAGIFKDSVALNAQLAQELGDETGANKFMCGDELARSQIGNPDLQDTCGREHSSQFDFPPSPFATLSADALKSHGELIEAIGKYGSALGEAADKGTITELEAAATNLGAAVGAALTPIAGSAAIPIISPAAKWIGRGLGLAVTSAYAIEIRQIMAETHPKLVLAAAELKNTFRIIGRQNDGKFKRLIADKAALLRTIRQDPKVTRSILNAEYRASVVTYRALRAKQETLIKYSGVLDALVKAHKSLMDGGPDTDKTLAVFVGLSNQLGDLASAFGSKK